MSGFYLLAGITHFAKPKMYMRIMPHYIPFHKPLVYISGAFEIGLGVLLLFPAYTTLAAWGIIALLIAVFPANVHQLTSSKPGKGLPRWMLITRLPFQLVLIFWAYWHTF